MTRSERSEYTYIKNSLKNLTPGPRCWLSIRTEAGHEYKQALHDLYTGMNFHPADLRRDSRYFDDKERLVYIHGRIWTDDAGNERSWEELYTAEEKARFEAALQ